MRVLGILFSIVLLITGAVAWAAYAQPIPPREDIVYGVTYTVAHARELGLDSQKTFDALVDDLGVRHFRLVAHWDLLEPHDGVYDLAELDYHMRRAESVGASVILAVGRRLPVWPECHIPDWALALGEEDRKEKLFEHMEFIVNRYKHSPALTHWQVENEPFIIGYARENCGPLDVAFLDEEIAHVRALDAAHPILLTASGELGIWNGTWERADVFGTTLYRHVYNADLKSFVTYPTTPWFFRAKRTITELTTGEKKPALISELAAEPWPVKAIVDTPLQEQLSLMSMERFEATLDFAARTSFTEQYLWGAEWWYYLKEVHGLQEYWERARELF